MSTLKLGQRSSSAIIGAFYKLCFFFALVQQQDAFKTLKRIEVFQKASIDMFIINGTHFEASFCGFYKDKHCKFCAILAEILP